MKALTTALHGLGVAMLLSSLADAALLAVVDTDNGEFFFKNDGQTSLTIDAYAINSPANELLTGAWTSVAGNYDSAGDGSVAPSDAWFVLSSTPTEVAEAGSVGSGSLAAGQVVSLGALWPTSGSQTLSVRAFDGLTESTLTADFRSLAADYDGDLVIDINDYVVFATTFGSTADLRADGNGDGLVNAADYTVWRDGFGLAMDAETSSLIDSSFLSAIGVPEPASGLLAVVLTSSLLGRRPR